MTEVLSIRPASRELGYIKEKMHNTKRNQSTVLRELLAKGILEDRKEEAVRQFKAGQATLREAAEIAGLTPRQSMDMLVQAGIRFGELRTGVREQMKALE